MAHDLHFSDGKASMMYVGEVPWHGLGTLLETAPKTADAAIQAANLNWEVGLKRVYAWEGDVFHEFTDRKAVVRLDHWGKEECAPFGMVGGDYQVLQNREAFSFFDPVIETGKVEYHTAGALGNGERVWVLAKVAGDIVVKGCDRVEKYLLLSNGHDGRTALQVRFTPIRVVCQNTLSVANQGRGDLVKVYHGRDMHRRLDSAQETVKKILGFYDDLQKQFESFATFQIKTDQLKAYHEAVFPTPKRKPNQSERTYEEALAVTRGLRQVSVDLFEKGRGNEESKVRGSLWAAYNGVTELVDHRMNYRNRRQRLDSLWFGDGERTKHRAFNEANVIVTSA
jgi:phage/plasmid-like protein (TIGR03299 family)